jgi:hypothetical protein
VRLKEVRTSHGTFWACENCGGETERCIPEAFFFKFEKNNVDTFAALRLKTQLQLHSTPSCAATGFSKRNPLLDLRFSSFAF